MVIQEEYGSIWAAGGQINISDQLVCCECMQFDEFILAATAAM